MTGKFRRIESPEIQEYEKENMERARKIAPECMVLLKSNGDFPLDNIGKIALYGNGARHTIKGGTGSGDVNTRHFVTIEEGLENAGFIITTSEWLGMYDQVKEESHKKYVDKVKKEAKEANANIAMYTMGMVEDEPEYELPIEGEGDVAVYVLARVSGEGSDRRDCNGAVRLTMAETRDILELNKKYKRFMLVLNVGGLVNLEPVLGIGNILLLGQLGSATGNAFADVLTGKSYPSGKLAMTWAGTSEYPSSGNFGDINDTYYKEGIYVGYRYFDTAGKTPLWPLGFGLSYTSFEIKNAKVDIAEGVVNVTATVKNTGNRPGKEVVQVYYSSPAGLLGKPYQELAGYAKTKELASQESQQVSITFKVSGMASYSEDRAAYILEKGFYDIRVGNSSRNTHIYARIRIDETIETEVCRNICECQEIITEDTVVNCISYADEEYERDTAPVINIDCASINTVVHRYSGDAEEFIQNKTISWEKLKENPQEIENYVAGLTDSQLADICIGAYMEGDGMGSVVGNASYKTAGAAGETTNHIDGMESVVMADGPAGVRISTSYKITGGVVKEQQSSLGSQFIEFLDEEQMEQMMAMMPVPSKEEEDLPVYYQYCTALPVGTAIAQSYSDEAAAVCGDIAGTEMEIFGINLWLAPALNIQRSPFCGRNFEYFSEDPVISGKTAAAITKGVHRHKGCSTTIKHFACNNQETNRYASNSIISERALREIYLEGFRICIEEEEPAALMTSYNLVNGEHTCSSRDLVTHVLRDEWGFKGAVITDWYVTSAMMKDQRSKYNEASAAGCVKAGNNITMPGMEQDKKEILNALKDTSFKYKITRADLQRNAAGVVKLVLGLV